MNTIDRAIRLLETQSAGLGVLLAAVVLAVGVGSLLVLALAGRFRLVSALLMIGAGLVVSTGIVQATYHAWYSHRCVVHHSDIRECDAARARRE